MTLFSSNFTTILFRNQIKIFSSFCQSAVFDIALFRRIIKQLPIWFQCSFKIGCIDFSKYCVQLYFFKKIYILIFKHAIYINQNFLHLQKFTKKNIITTKYVQKRYKLTSVLKTLSVQYLFNSLEILSLQMMLYTFYSKDFNSPKQSLRTLTAHFLFLFSLTVPKLIKRPTLSTLSLTGTKLYTKCWKAWIRVLLNFCQSIQATGATNERSRSDHAPLQQIGSYCPTDELLVKLQVTTLVYQRHT